MKCSYCGSEMKVRIIAGDGRGGVHWKKGDEHPSVWERCGRKGQLTAVGYYFPAQF